jgi:hypothetical protein
MASGGDQYDSGLSGWDSILQTGLSAIIDSQAAKNYAISDPAYNTAQGRAGQAQGFTVNTSNPLVWVVGIGIVALLVFALKR